MKHEILKETEETRNEERENMKRGTRNSKQGKVEGKEKGI